MFKSILVFLLTFLILVHGEHDLFLLDSSNLLKGDKEVWNLDPSELSNFMGRLLGVETQIIGSIVPSIDVFQSAERVLLFDFGHQQHKIMSEISIGTLKYVQVTHGDLHLDLQSPPISKFCYTSGTASSCPSEYTVQAIEDEDSFLLSLPSILSTLPTSSIIYIHLSDTFTPQKSAFETIYTQFPKNTISMFLFSTKNTYINSMKQNSLYSLSEIFDYQIFSWTTFILVLILVWIIISISQLDYGEDIAGLYSKFHPDSSKKDN